jgi:hypothetical protein
MIMEEDEILQRREKEQRTRKLQWAMELVFLHEVCDDMSFVIEIVEHS